MKKEDFIARYREWNDERLLSSFKNRKDYQAEAIEAMREVMRERNLYYRAEKMEYSDRVLEIAKMAAEEELVVTKQQNYEREMLGDVWDAYSFAKFSKGDDGVYMAGEVLRARFRIIRVFAMSWSLVAAIFTFMTLGLGPFFPYSTEVFAGSALVLGGLAFFMHTASMAVFRFYQRADRKNIFELDQAAFHFTATIPFTYSVCWDRIQREAKGLRVSHPVLYLTITNRQNESITLFSNLTAFQEPPPAWPHRSAITFPNGTVYFNEIPFKRVDLLRMKKIFDGLHEESGIRPEVSGSARGSAS